MPVNLHLKFIFIIFMLTAFTTLPGIAKDQDTLNLVGGNSLKELLSDQGQLTKRGHPYGGTIVWGAIQEPSIISPILTTHTISIDLLGVLFNTIVRINSKGNIEPCLAESWKESEDGLVYVFHLRKDVTFHDGKKFTAEDVAFTYEQFMDLTNKSPYQTQFELIEKIEVLDLYMIKIVLSKPFPAFLYQLAEREIMPKHVYEKEDLFTTPFNYRPVGTGPFEFKSWDKKNNQIELVANPDYFEGRPYLDKIIVKIYPDNAHIWSAIMRQEIDLMLYLEKKDFEITKKDMGFHVFEDPSRIYFAIVYDLNDSILQDQKVRKAIAWGINVEKIIDETFKEGVKCTGPFHPGSMGFNPDVKIFDYNPVKAKMMLMHQGWRDLDNDGILEKDNKELVINLLIDATREIYRKMAMLIRQQLAEIGIKVKVVYYTNEEELTEEFLKKTSSQAWLRFFNGKGYGTYDAAGSGFSLSADPSQIWKYDNLEVNRLFETGKSSSDKHELIKTYKRIHQIIYDDQPACFLFFPVSYHAVSKKFKNIEGFFNQYMPIYTMKDWYISD